MYWANENPNIVEEKTVNLQGVVVLCGLSSRGLIGPHVFEETVTSQIYLQMLEIMIPYHNDLFENENEVYFQQDGLHLSFTSICEIFSIARSIRDW